MYAPIETWIRQLLNGPLANARCGDEARPDTMSPEVAKQQGEA